MNLRKTMLTLLCLLSLFSFTFSAHADEPKTIKLLFLGDNGHHVPVERFRMLQPVMAQRGIDITYTDSVDALNPKTLNKYDGLIIYANTEKISPDQEKALLDYVASGKGFIPLHCASYCFLNSPRYIELVGAQFQKHGTGVFRTTVVTSEEPIVKGYDGFESWDETYVHTKHNKDRKILEYRVSDSGKEPWTWIRKHGKGRVFYTAWSHDDRTWTNPGFQNLVERGIRWAVGADVAVVPAFTDQPEMTAKRKDVRPFQYKEAKIPFYPPSKRWGTQAEPLTQMQLPLEGSEALKHVVHPKDFELQLFASDPQIKRPICMNWDERGRLWIAETVDYPNELKGTGQGRDRIVILEDTDKDGKADKFTVFADKLSIPTSLTFYKGGVLVFQYPHTLYLKDTDGDDRADERKILFTGWNPGDTHAGPSNMQYGFDNWIYGITGYSGFRGTVGGERVSFQTGFFRFKPDGSKMEFLRNTNNNSWGVGFSEEGILFGSTANGNPSVYLPIPNRYYERVRGWSSSVLGGIAIDAYFHPITDKIRQVDHHGKFTAGAGHAVYTARTYPAYYWNRTAFVNGPTGHLTATFVLQPKGSDFISRYGWNLFASDDEWSAPIMAEVGPDGNVWVIDWYNYIVQHNPTPAGYKTGKGNAYETNLRDKTHGRIYRLVYKGARDPSPITLKDATPEKLVATLKNDNLFWRKHAQRLLVERGKKDVVPALLKLVAAKDVDAIGLNPGAIHALWTLQGLGVTKGDEGGINDAIGQALKHPSAGVRRNAVQVLPRTVEGGEALLASGILEDPDAQVRLAALLSLSEMPPLPQAGPALAKVMARPENITDRWIPDAITSAAAAQDVHFLKALASDSKELSPRGFKIASIVAEHYARGGPVETVFQVLEESAKAEPKFAEVVVGGLAKGWPKRLAVKMNKDQEKALVQLVKKLPTGASGQLVRLTGIWGSDVFSKNTEEIVNSLLKTVRDRKESASDRINAARQVIDFRIKDDKIVGKLLAVIDPSLPPNLALGILEALEKSQSSELGNLLVKRLPQLTPSVREATLRLLLRRPDSTLALLGALEKNQVQLQELTLDQKQALASHPDEKIASMAKELLARGGGLPNADRQKVVEQLLQVVKMHGDVANGKAMFKKHCALCHKHGSEGAEIGPELTGMAVHPREELLVHIMDPSRSVEGNFRVYTAVTKDGQVINGLLASETRTSLELIDTQAKKHILLREDVEELVASNKSLMPEGFEKQMSEKEVVDLLEFLTQRGKYLPIPLQKYATIVSTQGMFFDKEGTTERLIFRDWSPKTFKGVPFSFVDPKGTRVANVILLRGPNGNIAPKMPKSVELPCNSPAKSIHLLSGISGWGYPVGQKGTVSMIVRLQYADGKTEDHKLLNGVHFADYIRRVDVPGSEFAYQLRGQQLRYLNIQPEREETIRTIELISGGDQSAPIVMAVTVETK